MGAVAVAGGAVATVLAPFGPSLGVTLAALGVVWVAEAVAYGPTGGRREQPHAGKGGLVLPHSPLRARAARVETAALFVAGVAILVSPHRARGVVIGLLAIALAVTTKHPARALVLTPAGVTYERGPERWQVAWDRVARVEARADPFWERGPSEWSIALVADGDVVRRTDTATHRVSSRRGAGEARLAELAVDADPLGIDPVTAYWALRFYAEHPDARAELADGRAAARISRGDLGA